MLFEGNDPSNTNQLTYSEVLEKVCKLVGNVASQSNAERLD